MLLGGASGFTLAAALAASPQPRWCGFSPAGPSSSPCWRWSAASASLMRNARLKPQSTLQSAIGIKHPRIVQKAQGFMGGSFNTREFFHGAPAGAPALGQVGLPRAGVRRCRWLLLALGAARPRRRCCWRASWCSTSGLLAERWFFFAQANHPQNLYYQAVT